MTHPLIPPPELRQLWKEQYYGCNKGFNELLTEVAQYGADQELEACCEWLQQNCGRWEISMSLRAARRPKPPSFKEQALAILASVAVCELHGDAAPDNRLSTKDIDTIRRALEALSDD